MRIVLIIALVTLLFNSCKRGCKDEKACNYDTNAKLKGTCSYDPYNVKVITFRRSFSSSNDCYGLDLSTGAVTTSTVPLTGLLYYNYSSYGGILHLEGSESVSDQGPVKSLCEVTDKSGPYASPNVRSGEHGYVVYLRSTNTYARVYVVAILFQEDRITIKFEYPY